MLPARVTGREKLLSSVLHPPPSTPTDLTGLLPCRLVCALCLAHGSALHPSPQPASFPFTPIMLITWGKSGVKVGGQEKMRWATE